MSSSLIARAEGLRRALAPDGGTDPGIKVNWAFFPFMAALKDAVGGVLAVAIVLCVVLLIAFAVTWGAGKLGGSRGAQSVGAGGFIAVAIVSVLVGAASGIVAWATAIDTGF